MSDIRLGDVVTPRRYLNDKWDHAVVTDIEEITAPGRSRLIRLQRADGKGRWLRMSDVELD